MHVEVRNMQGNMFRTPLQHDVKSTSCTRIRTVQIWNMEMYTSRFYFNTIAHPRTNQTNGRRCLVSSLIGCHSSGRLNRDVGRRPPSSTPPSSSPSSSRRASPSRGHPHQPTSAHAPPSSTNHPNHLPTHSAPDRQRAPANTMSHETGASWWDSLLGGHWI